MATVIRAEFRRVMCFRCGLPVERERMIALCVRSVEQATPLERGEQMCAGCEEGMQILPATPVITMTEFAAYLAAQGFGEARELSARTPISS
jgi:hypothetical protein